MTEHNAAYPPRGARQAVQHGYDRWWRALVKQGREVVYICPHVHESGAMDCPDMNLELARRQRDFRAHNEVNK